MNSVVLSASVKEKVRDHVKNGQLYLTSRSIKELLEQKFMSTPMIHQLIRFKWENSLDGTCARTKLFDGEQVYKFVHFKDSLSEQLKADGIVGKTSEPGEGGEVIMISKGHFEGENTTTGSPIFLIEEYDLLAKGVPLMDKCATEHYGTTEAIELYRIMLRNPPAENSCCIPFDVSDSSSSIAAASTSAPTTPTKTSGTGKAVTPIADVLPYVSRQKIRGVCTSTDFRTTANGTKVFAFILTDEKETAIRIVGFADVAERTKDIVKENEVYYVSGGAVRTAERMFNTTDHQFEITLRADTEITPCHDVVIAPPALTFNICPLDRICDFKDQQVDILAIIDVMEPVNNFTSRAGKRLTKRDMYLLDKTGTSVQFTLWNEQTSRIQDDARGKAIGIKGAFVKLWTGGYTLSAIASTKWELVPNLPEVKSLYGWYTFKRQISQSSQASTIGGSILIRDLLTSQDSQGLDDKELKVEASITSIQQTMFKSCTNDNCGQKVVSVENSFYCQVCDRTAEACRWRKTVTLELSDCTGTVLVNAFEDIAEKVFGVYAQQRNPQDSDSRPLPKTLEEQGSKKYVFTLYRAPVSEDEDSRVRYHVLEVTEVNIERYFTELQKTVDQTFP